MELGRRFPYPVRTWGWYAATSLLLLAPVFWQPRVQAGDLSSHIYNAWLAQLIESGRAQGLLMVRQTTNVLFDMLLSFFFRWFGPESAQRLAVSIAVLVFVWGAFAFVSKVSGKRAWHLLPCLSMLAYGWVFHMGFFNFYLSLGLCFWALALAWDLRRRDLLCAAPVLILAYLAHALPVIWICGLLTYVSMARRLTPWRRVLLSAASILLMAIFHLVIARMMLTQWSPAQFTVFSGIDQVWVFDGKYYVIAMGLIATWGLLFLSLIRRDGARAVMSSIPFQLCMVGAAAIFVLPGTVLIPGFFQSLGYIAERMSLGVAVCVCALLGSVEPKAHVRWAMGIVALVFFGFVYVDERALNSFEDQMEKVISMLPPGQRVVSPIMDDEMRINALSHMLDRVCIGRCYSYGNYEPATGQFRIRALEGNPIVAAKIADSWHLQNGEYLVNSSDLPLYKVDIDSRGRLFLTSLEAGRRCGGRFWRTLPSLFPLS